MTQDEDRQADEFLAFGDRAIVLHPNTYRIFIEALNSKGEVKMSKFRTLLAKAKTLFTALPTYLSLAAVVVTAFGEEIAAVLSPERSEVLARLTVTVLAWLTAAANIVRRVTPVTASERGLS